MNFRTITILGTLQVLLVVAGVLGLGIIMWMNGYPKYNFIKWTDTALFLRHYGFTMVAVPLIWTALAVKFKDSSYDSNKIIYTSGITICCFIFLVFIYSMINYRRPLIISL